MLIPRATYLHLVAAISLLGTSVPTDGAPALHAALQPPAISPVTTAVPHVLHLSWRSTSIPSAHLENFLSLVDVLSDKGHDAAGAAKSARGWVVLFWTDEANARLVQSAYPSLLPLYESYSPIQRANLARYLYLQAIGGVYMDLDFISLRPVTPYLEDNTVFVGQEPLEHSLVLWGKKRLISNSIMASPPRHSFWGHLLANIGKYAHNPFPRNSTGPHVLEREAKMWARRQRTQRHRRLQTGVAHQFSVAPPRAFFPMWDEFRRHQIMHVCNQPKSLSRAQEAVCNPLRKSNYLNMLKTMKGCTAIHQYSHTWMAEEGYSKVNVKKTITLRPIMQLRSDRGRDEDLINRTWLHYGRGYTIHGRKARYQQLHSEGPPPGVTTAVAPGDLQRTMDLIAKARALIASRRRNS